MPSHLQYLCNCYQVFKRRLYGTLETSYYIMIFTTHMLSPVLPESVIWLKINGGQMDKSIKTNKFFNPLFQNLQKVSEFKEMEELQLWLSSS